MGKYNFDFEISAKGWGKSDVIIYEKGQVYISRAAVKRLGISDQKFRWGEDKANKTLALKEDPDGRAVSEKGVTNFHCPAEVARRYAGRYNLKAEEGVYVLYPVEGARP